MEREGRHQWGWVEVMSEDDQSTPAGAVNAFNKLVTPAFILAAHHGVCLAIDVAHHIRKTARHHWCRNPAITRGETVSSSVRA